MYGWPGLAIAPGGGLIVAASERKHHVCPFGRIVVVRSGDADVGWSLPEEIGNSELDDRHPSLATMPDGTVVCSFLTVNSWMNGTVKEEWQARASRVTKEVAEASLGDWLVRSFDGGMTWDGVPHRMPNGGSLHASPYAAMDGTLRCFGYEMTAGVVQPYFFKSDDHGATWSRIGVMPPGDIVNGSFAWAPWQITRGKSVDTTPYSMRSIVETDPGRFVALFGGPGGLLYQTESSDDGGTWRAPTETPMWGFPPQLLRLQSGVLMCTFGHRRDPYSIRCVFSSDEGKTWDVNGLVTIEEWPDQPDGGYPVVVEATPGELTVVYYVHREPGEKLAAMEPSGIIARKLSLR
jgi:hypothetical protein